MVSPEDIPGHRIRICFLPDPLQVRRALTEATEACRTLWPSLTVDKLGDIQIALAEVLNNIAEHAFSDRPLEMASVTLHTDGSDLRAVFVDQGHPMPGLLPPPGILPEIGEEKDDLPEGGFGWFLVHELSDAVMYRRVGSQNQLNLVFHLAGHVH